MNYSILIRLSSMSLLLLLIVLGYGCGVKNPELVKIEQIEFMEQRDSFVDVNLSVVLYNPNGFGTTISSIAGNIELEGIDIAKLMVTDEFKLKAKGNTAITFPILINLADLSAVFPKAMRKDTSVFTLHGDFQVDLGISTVNIKRKVSLGVDLREELSKQIQQQLNQSFRLSKLSPKSLSTGSTIFNVDVLIRNPLSIPLSLIQADIHFFMADAKDPFSKWIYNEPFEIAAKSDRLLKTEIELLNANIISQFMGMIFGSKEVKAVGKSRMELDCYQFDVDINQKISLSSQIGF